VPDLERIQHVFDVVVDAADHDHVALQHRVEHGGAFRRLAPQSLAGEVEGGAVGPQALVVGHRGSSP